jgi:hypothetical protein
MFLLCLLMRTRSGVSLVQALDAAMILLNPVVEITIGPMAHSFAEFGPDRPAVVPVRRDPVMPVTDLAERQNVLAAAISRVSLHLTSSSHQRRSATRAYRPMTEPGSVA